MSTFNTFFKEKSIFISTGSLGILLSLLYPPGVYAMETPVIQTDMVSSLNLDSVNELIAKAGQGDVDSQIRLGEMYHYGGSVDQDYEKAVFYYTLAADQGNEGAQCILGHMDYNKVNVVQDYGYHNAFHYYTLAANQGHAEALWGLGNIYYHGKGVGQDLGKAFHYYMLSAEQGHAEAQFSVAKMYFVGVKDAEGNQVIEQNHNESARYHMLAADQGHAKAQFALADLYYEDGGNRPDALNYYTLAAGQGHAGAHSMLGFMYYNGIVLGKDVQEALKYFTFAAEHGDAGAQGYLGFLYCEGPGVDVDMEKAIRYWVLGAAQEDKTCLNALTWTYDEGRKGVKKDVLRSLGFAYRASYREHLLTLLHLVNEQEGVDTLNIDFPTYYIDIDGFGDEMMKRSFYHLMANDKVQGLASSPFEASYEKLVNFSYGLKTTLQSLEENPVGLLLTCIQPTKQLKNEYVPDSAGEKSGFCYLKVGKMKYCCLGGEAPRYGYDIKRFLRSKQEVLQEVEKLTFALN